MEYLHSYARGTDPTTGRRRRVIVTIHQPSSQIWEVIDNGKKCYLMSFSMIFTHLHLTIYSVFLSRSTCRRTFDVSRG